ncbi:MAG: ATP phosphoribosyltransferase regulatory subunit [Tepidibacter sp.]|jgi:ATP phosphoribosyltransferase regulatory subunit|uniref:ATP phosphoribosyltransferase regulatory subunit n=1 Tax=Tepidibacter sp. TaxID=2529387 RepID=UPI0025E73FFF|nr:ATP phosphoribosyltransferase regulatory subunit [Tepidibacter sp.]MCT4508280.1 ATP phosphoribosyltransferase regulatory subunit [Tepidibacter sp.]
MEFLKIKDEIDYLNKRYKITREIEDMFIDDGCINIEPSIFEDYDNFMFVNKRIKKESMVKVLNGNSNILILRPDITMNIIKNLIPRWEDDLKLKLFYNSTIFRNKAGLNIKEFRQMGIEYIGESSMKADRDLIGIALKVLKKYNNSFILEIGNSKYVDEILRVIDLEESVEKELKSLIYKKNKIELIDYVGNLNIKKEICELLSNILDFQGNIEEIIKKAEKFYMSDEMKKSIEDLKDLNEFIREYGYLKNIHFDLSMVAELDYYEGIVFKGYYENSYREIISGGRYDSLTELFGEKVSAIGFSIDIDELIKVLNKKGDGNWII